MRRNTTYNSFLLLSALVFTGMGAVAQTASKPQNGKMKVKTITIIDGDTTVKEQTMNEIELKDLEKNLGDLQGKNVNINVTALAGMENDLSNLDSLLKNIQIEELNDETSDGKSSRKRVKKVIINNKGGNSANAYSYSFSDDDGSPSDLIISNDGKTTIIKGDTAGGKTERIIINEAKDGKKNQKVIVKTICKSDSKGGLKEKQAGSTKEMKMDELNFYPNPSTGKFTLEFETSDKEPVQVNVTDVNGKEVFHETVKGEEKYKRNIELSAESKGVYIINLLQGKKKSSRKIIIE